MNPLVLFGLKGVGEIATNGPLPAIANAVADALDTPRVPVSADARKNS